MSSVIRHPSLDIRHSAAPQRRRGGFALLITITLLAFLVLLLVSLAALTRVETQVAANSQQLAQARQNALMALNIAVGQLQKYAGPDQRTTARSDLDAALANDPARNGRWTGVYGNRVSANYADAPDTIATEIAAAPGTQAILLNWLVSGNQATAFNPLSDIASDGHITLATAPTPTHVPTAATLAAASATPSASDAHTLLVGPASVSTASDRVSAPLVKIEIPESSLPGFDAASTTPRTIGRYAWWVGDEGAKAHINLAPKSGQAPLSFDNPEYAFAISQRSAVELIDKVNPVGSAAPFNPGDLVASAYNPAQTSINKLLTTQQLSALDASVWEPARKLRFHDLTAASYSLPTDTYAGGLKQDLSAMLAPGASAPAGNAPLVVIQPGDTRPYANTPTWGQLRSFLNPQRDSNGSLLPRLPREDQSGLSPVMTYASLKLEWFGAEGSTFRIAIFPQVVLWNPYTEPLAPADYEFGYSSQGDRFRLLKKRPSDPAVPVWDGWEAVENASPNNGYRSIQHALGFGAAGAPHHHMRFLIRVAAPIPPGESHVFAFPSGHASAWSRPMTGDAPQNPSDTLVRRGTGVPGYAWFDTGITRESGADYAIGTNNTSTFGFSWVFLGEKNASTAATVQPVLGGSLYGTNDHLWPPQNETGNPRWYQGARAIGLTGSPTLERGILQDDASIHAAPLGPEVNAWGPSIYYHFDNNNNARHLVALNPRAPVFEFNPVLRTKAHGTDYSPFNAGNFPDPEITADGRTSANRYFILNSGSPTDLILFESPRAGQPLLSLGQLQHANLGYNHRSGGYLIGNSAAPSWGVAADRARLFFADTSNATYNGTVYRYDCSWLLNRALWDRYFVSTVPQTGAMPDILPNPRLIRQSAATDADLRDAAKAAAHLLVKGGFNINSTSAQAWRAVLGAANQLVIPPDTATGFIGTEEGTDDAPGAAFPRFSRPLPPLAPSTTNPNWAFTGYRRLTEAQIATLADRIVQHVRDRGPFVSLADFINRRLSADVTTDRALKGVLQTAIDTAGNAINPTSSPFGTLVTTYIANNVVGGDQYAFYGGTTRTAPYSTAQAYAPQFLTQADMLSLIGPGLSARSDTFTIRTYGEVQNPATGEIAGRAWCEAVVQRTVEPLRRKSSTPADADYNEPAAPTAAEADFGRRFKITSFRWLSPSDI